ncbi:MAG TPA: hypothetical protein VJP45_12360 [Candidatus Limnocylindria bacterium]|nr:hypothetical protein [Candidatus Limnocylindria bacterium]
MNILRRLREQAKEYDCKACGANHANSEIRLLSRLDAAWVVKVTCWSCKTSIRLLVYADRERAALASMRERSVRNRRPPISLDEVIDAHEFLERFDGDVRALFSGRGKVVGSTEL